MLAPPGGLETRVKLSGKHARVSALSHDQMFIANDNDVILASRYMYRCLTGSAFMPINTFTLMQINTDTTMG